MQNWKPTNRTRDKVKIDFVRNSLPNKNKTQRTSTQKDKKNHAPRALSEDRGQKKQFGANRQEDKSARGHFFAAYATEPRQWPSSQDGDVLHHICQPPLRIFPHEQHSRRWDGWEWRLRPRMAQCAPGRPCTKIQEHLETRAISLDYHHQHEGFGSSCGLNVASG